MATVYPNDMLSPTFLMGAIQERPERNAIKQKYIGEMLFPRREVPERRLMWDSLVTENNLAGFYSVKGHAIPGDDTMFKTHFADLIDVKASRYLDPDIVSKIRDAGMTAVIKNAGDSFTIRGIQQRVQEHVSNNLAWCDDAVDAQLEYMAVNAMLGTLEWPPKDADGNTIADPMPHWNPDLKVTVNWPLKAEFVQNASTLVGYKSRVGGGDAWNAASGSDPILDLEVIAELFVEEKGLDPSNALIIMSRATLSRLAFNDKILQWILGANHVQTGAREYVDVADVKSYIQTKLGYEIMLYDAQWTYKTLNKNTGVETVRRVKFLPEGKLIFLPKDSKPGFMAMAPHETQDGSFRSGKIPWVYRQPLPPYERQMGVNLVAFPILQRPEEHFVLNAYA